MFVVVDTVDNQVYGPFDSETQAKSWADEPKSDLFGYYAVEVTFVDAERAETEPVATCPECGQPLVFGIEVEGEADPVHIFCDICGEAEHPADLTPDWNGETGCHLSCEEHVSSPGEVPSRYIHGLAQALFHSSLTT